MGKIVGEVSEEEKEEAPVSVTQTNAGKRMQAYHPRRNKMVQCDILDVQVDKEFDEGPEVWVCQISDLGGHVWPPELVRKELLEEL